MSIEKTLITRSQPYIVSNLANSMIELEARKGCNPEICNSEVSLEPKYTYPMNWFSQQKLTLDSNYVHEKTTAILDKSLKCWIPLEYKIEWFRSERFIKLLKSVHKRICFEIIGNSTEIQIQFRVNENDQVLLKTAFDSEYSECELTPSSDSQFSKENISFFDYYPLPPYHHLFTRSKELTVSGFEPFFFGINNITDEDLGFIQVIFEPVRNNWHENVELLNDLEFIGNVINDPRSSARIKQQLPSTDIRNMARDVETKAHNDKPFFSVAIRSGIITNNTNIDLSGITAFMNLFQHGGNSLKYITNKDYEQILAKHEIVEMFEQCLTYRCGFLLNSAELSGIVHIPSLTDLYEHKLPLNYLEDAKTKFDKMSNVEGIKVGRSNYAGQSKEVIIDNSVRTTGTHIIGRSGSGKSTLMENMVLQDIEDDIGVAVIDPHGDSVKRLLKLIPYKKIESTIYIDFGDTEYIPIWNPIKRIPNQNIGRTVDDLVSAFKSIIRDNAWGDRLEHLLRNGFYGLLHLDDSTFYDLLIIFEQSRIESREKRILKNMIKKEIDSPVAKRFWEKDFSSYKRNDFTPPHHKLSKLLNSDERVSLMLSQPDSYIDLKKIMNENRILLLDLSNIGPDTRKVLGSYLLSTLHNYAISKNKTEIKDRTKFAIYCDEAHKFTPDTLEDLITDARKFGINLTLVHQYLNQFNISQRDALLSCGSTIIFNVDLADARFLINNLQGKVEAKDIAILKTGEAFARIGTNIVKTETDIPKPILEKNFQHDIINYSRKKYYKPINEVKRKVEERLRKFGLEISPYISTPVVEFSNNGRFSNTYDEFK